MKKNQSNNTAPITRIIVVGASAGGLNAISQLASQLPKDLTAPVMIVQHISPDATGNVLLDAISRSTNLKCAHAKDKTRLKAGHLYLAPSGHHLMVETDGKMLITKGAHENRSRPAIDPLFRSAAVAYGNAVIAVLLTGYLDDGTSGMEVVKRCGGITIVQDPSDAQYPDMPRNALNRVQIDHCVPVSEMGALLVRLLSQKPGKARPIPNDIQIESNIATRVISDLPSVNVLGEQVPFNCPGCGGVLWKIEKDTSLRYRCHTGHAYTAATLLADQTMKIEETMWTALRMFEERRNLLLTVSKDSRGAAAAAALERANLSQVHIDRIKAILQADDKGTIADIPV